MYNKLLKESLIILLFDAISNIDDLDDVACYNFEFELSGSIIKGVVKVGFKEVE